MKIQLVELTCWALGKNSECEAKEIETMQNESRERENN